MCWYVGKYRCANMCKCMYVYTCMYEDVIVYMFVYFGCVYMGKNKYKCMCLQMCMCVCVYIYIYIFVRWEDMYQCVYVCK